MKLLKLDEAIDIVRCSKTTLRRAIHSGQIPAYKPGKELLIDEKDLKDWIRKRQIVPRMDARLIEHAHPKVTPLLKKAS